MRLTLKAVCIMFQVKSVKIADPDNPQKKIDDYWGPSQKMLNDFGPDKFKKELIDFKKDEIPAEVIKLIDPVCDMEEFAPNVIVKVSVACEAMCMWVHAMPRTTTSARGRAEAPGVPSQRRSSARRRRCARTPRRS